jgi:4-aminobutyrate aminotransferase/(S)-3-amino-2-methylpropionate transaminase
MTSEAFGRLLPEVVHRPPGPRSRALSERLASVEVGNVTYFDQDWPVFWEAAKGSNVLDVDGNVYLDLSGAFGVSLLGHAPDSTLVALRRQSERLVHGMGDVHPPAVKVELLERLARLAPWSDTRTLLGSSGSEAVEAALKTAQVATGRPGVVAFKGSYHGLTAGSLATTERMHFREPFREQLFAGVEFVPYPVTPAEAEATLATVSRLFDEGTAAGHRVGAVLVEPVQGRGGVRIPPEPFLADLVRLARESGVVSIFDEIFTGLGRTGALFRGPAVGAVPDILCLGKALGGGLPISACLGSAEVMDAWPESSGEAIHTSTFLGHPLACATAIAFLDELEDGDVIARAAELGERIVADLGRMLDDVVQVAEVRGAGLLIGVQLTGVSPGTGVEVAKEALRNGVILLPAGPTGDVVELAPPVSIADDQLEVGVAVTVQAIRTAALGRTG